MTEPRTLPVYPFSRNARKYSVPEGDDNFPYPNL